MKGLSPETTRDLILSVGTHQSTRPLLPVQVAYAMKAALDAGSSWNELAEALQLEGPSMVRRFIRLLELPQEAQLLVGWRKDETTISFSTASEITRLDSAEEKQLMAKAVLENQMTKSEVIEVVQINERSAKTLPACIEDVIRRRKVIEKRYLLIGSLKDGELVERLCRLAQPDKNQILVDALSRSEFGRPCYGARIAGNTFFMMGDELFHSKLTSLSSPFDELVTDLVRTECDRRG